MVAGDVVGKERLDIDHNAAAVLQHPDALVKDPEQLGEVGSPMVGVSGFLIAQPEVVGRGSEHQVNAVVRQLLQPFLAVAADYPIYKIGGEQVAVPAEIAAVGVVMLAALPFLFLAVGYLALSVKAHIQALVAVDAVAADAFHLTDYALQRIPAAVLGGRRRYRRRQFLQVHLPQPDVHPVAIAGNIKIVRIEPSVQSG